MAVKDTYFIRITDDNDPAAPPRYGECALFRGLSADDRPDYEARLAEACRNPVAALDSPLSSIRFGFETALAQPPHGQWAEGKAGIPINGLVWMGDRQTMASRIAEKIDAGFRVLKLKIGGIAFDDEIDLLKAVRREFSPDELEVRLDANGSFAPGEAYDKLCRLAEFSIHSLEQPVKAGQPELMAKLCASSPIPLALDEELIGMRSPQEARSLVSAIMPQYIILKPALCGGLRASAEYAAMAAELGIGWWATSALESNIGLFSIAAWVDAAGNPAVQGLGTGQLYFNNIPSTLELRGSRLFNNPELSAPDLEHLPWRQ